ncbi:trafficking protein particle complex subunit 6B [Coprinopsis cinerea okayama7|uniref:Trafficking protein particle complex subunit 6B n=1 Tax=Coprinopsis cinerea (strain Okayama-7 / 130 / ATCC MYA-4618 / FGSC 9003) TaxID=240176 RepID=A8N0N0_COPC7|nr:trafficking protein particle complex subunit 6B [Coprinopsis cinerea okayama7\|eukprot:XP_001828362.1 trafficking protein particle complex subunit 6B [Coprinopsis cinerea okayama7\
MAARASTSSLAPVSLSTLSDPPIRHIDATAYEYFLIEMVSTLRESAAYATARSKAIEKEMADAGLIVPTPTTVTGPPAASGSRGSQPPGPRDSVTSLQSTTRPKSSASGAGGDADDPTLDPLRHRLLAIGSHTGANLSERLCLHRPPFTDTLDVIKFICKDLWNALFNKQIDNLRTNHRGVYVLQDNSFKPIQRVSLPSGPGTGGKAEAVRRAKVYTLMFAGVVQGALERLGYPPTSVTPEISNLPNCTFQVRMPKGST